MKKLTSILLVMVFISPFLFKAFVVVNWFVNKQYIVENLCVQKNEEVNTCKGACHLKANLEKVDAAQNENQAGKKYKFNENYKDFISVEEELLNLSSASVTIELSTRLDFSFQDFFTIHSPPPQLA
ncbi:MAG: hypothetical protein H6579_02410 [Chitinophagales bacterium]|nr:hypothetical protein [Bacteroidota bacterium]MCB9255962.1 hypothetical protein [Chitinophagales bacterium]